MPAIRYSSQRFVTCKHRPSRADNGKCARQIEERFHPRSLHLFVSFFFVFIIVRNGSLVSTENRPKVRLCGPFCWNHLSGPGRPAKCGREARLERSSLSTPLTRLPLRQECFRTYSLCSSRSSNHRNLTVPSHLPHGLVKLESAP